MSDKNFWDKQKLEKRKLDIIQINLGNLCNLRCKHCHIQASPQGNLNMQAETAYRIMHKLLEIDVQNIELTGGAPEMNPNFMRFIEHLAPNGKSMTVRTNLTVLKSSKFSYLPGLFRKHRVKLVASLPSFFADATDNQRGRGVFDKSIEIIQNLNRIGYGTNGLALDFVYNPVGEYLPPSQAQLQEEYKQILHDKYNIKFNNLVTIVNSPITRYKETLQAKGCYSDYLDLLKRNYNAATLDRIMCRNLITVDHEGYIYDCDFNLALKIRIKDFENIKFWEIDFNNFYPEITFADHCYACTVNNGSSCHGALLSDESELNVTYNYENQTQPITGKAFNVREHVQRYYGEEIQQNTDLKTNACCTGDDIPDYIKNILPLIHDEIKMKYYGCGTTIPPDIKGLSVLDVGCGAGRDTYIIAKLVGPSGFVYGIDMTQEQIEIAQRYINDQARRFEYSKPNTMFIKDYMENIAHHFKPESLDLVTSNCVINLAEDKEIVLQHIFNILKNNAEFYFSDVYVDRRLPDEVRKDHILYGECLGGALYQKDFERIAKKVGFKDPRIVSQQVITITDEKISKLIGNANFCSITYRLWKIPGLEDACEDYGHIAIYRGGSTFDKFKFTLDVEHVFEKNRPERICGNTALMLSKTRLSEFFEVIGDFKEHFGLFQTCGTSVLHTNKDNSNRNSCDCF